MLFVASEFFIYTLPALEIRYFFLLLFPTKCFSFFPQHIYCTWTISLSEFSSFFFFSANKCDGEKNHFVLLQFIYNSLLSFPFSGEFCSSPIVSYQTVSRMLPSSSTSALRFFHPKKYNNNTSFLSCTIYLKSFWLMMKWAMKLKLNVAFFCLKRDSRHSVVNHSHRRLPFAVVIESTPNSKSADLIVLLYNNNWHAL